MRICVIGTGYVGLVTGAVFADLGNEVVCVDKDEEKIRMLTLGKMPIYEPGLEEMVAHNSKDGRLHFTTSIPDGVRASEVIFIAVGTPPKTNGETDLSSVEECARGIGLSMNGYKVVVSKSTVPVGTGDFVRRVIEQHKVGDIDFDVVSNPEFLREGNAINDTLHPDRIVIGAPNKEVAMKILELYAPLERPMLITGVYSAEMIKYASNGFLATKISFMNAIADICERAGADVVDVMRGMGYDRRIGPDFLSAGLGFGGSCFGKDASSFVHTAESLGYDFELLRAVIEINLNRPRQMVAKMAEAMGSLRGRVVAILGLAFKPNTDDMRDARSIDLIKELLQEGAVVRAYDPIAIENAKKILPEIQYCSRSYEVVEGADALVLVTEWSEFRFLDLERVKALMKGNWVFDGRNVYDPDRMRRCGFEYHGMGRGADNMGEAHRLNKAA
jgi:UDPglucose 6-dehydrogenase